MLNPLSAKTVPVPSGANFYRAGPRRSAISIAHKEVAGRVKSRSAGCATPTLASAKTLAAPSGVNFSIVAFCALATKTLPALSIAIPCGALKPLVEKTVLVPSGATLRME